MDITISNTRKYNNNVFSSTVFQLKGISEYMVIYFVQITKDRDDSMWQTLINIKCRFSSYNPIRVWVRNEGKILEFLEK